MPSNRHSYRELFFAEIITEPYGHGNKYTVSGSMAPCDEQGTKGGEAVCLGGETLDDFGRQFSVAK